MACPQGFWGLEGLDWNYRCGNDGRQGEDGKPDKITTCI